MLSFVVLMFYIFFLRIENQHDIKQLTESTFCMFVDRNVKLKFHLAHKIYYGIPRILIHIHSRNNVRFRLFPIHL